MSINEGMETIKRALDTTGDAIATAKDTAKLARVAIDQRNMFAAAFIHACDDEGTYFGLRRLYEMAKSSTTKEAEEFVYKVAKDERGY